MFNVQKHIALLLTVLLIAGCGKNLEWTEDVQLLDEREITLERKVEFDGGSSHFGDPSVESRQYFKFKHPDNSAVVEWTNTSENGTLRTLALWIENGVPFLLTTPAYGGDSRKFGCPNPPYVLFSYKSGGWNNIPLMEIPVKQVRANLSFVPLEDRARIEKHKFHLPISETANSITYSRGVFPVPYLIDFRHMTEQTFDSANCDRQPSYLTPAG